MGAGKDEFKLNILLVEDDYDLAETICEYLEMEGLICHHAGNGRAGLSFALEHYFQVILLDLNLPKMDGLDICRHLRQKGVDTPVLMVTARDSLANRIDGFRAGTDDYLIKPFALEELAVRIIALSKRRSGQITKLACGSLEMDLEARTVVRGNMDIRLSPSLWTLLEALLRASPGVVSRTELERALWGEDIPESNSLNVHMHHLRKAVDGPFSQQLIHTVSRHGFSLCQGAAG
ncbi:MAG: response regulator transcription factor [Desulfobacter sp.]|nr:MAG: response regulator transcription factor [Desulfobacter sp.]